MCGNPFGEFLSLVLLLHKEEGPFSLEEVREVTDYILREGGGGLYIHESYDYICSLSRISEYPELFKKSIDQDGKITFSRAGNLRPKLEFFFGRKNEVKKELKFCYFLIFVIKCMKKSVIHFYFIKLKSNMVSLDNSR